MKFKISDGIRIICSIGLIIFMWFGWKFALYFNVTLCCFGTEINAWVIRAMNEVSDAKV